VADREGRKGKTCVGSEETGGIKRLERGKKGLSQFTVLGKKGRCLIAGTGGAESQVSKGGEMNDKITNYRRGNRSE